MSDSLGWRIVSISVRFQSEGKTIHPDCIERTDGKVSVRAVNTEVIHNVMTVLAEGPEQQASGLISAEELSRMLYRTMKSAKDGWRNRCMADLVGGHRTCDWSAGPTVLISTELVWLARGCGRDCGC